MPIYVINRRCRTTVKPFASKPPQAGPVLAGSSTQASPRESLRIGFGFTPAWLARRKPNTTNWLLRNRNAKRCTVISAISLYI